MYASMCFDKLLHKLVCACARFTILIIYKIPFPSFFINVTFVFVPLKLVLIFLVDFISDVIEVGENRGGGYQRRDTKDK